MTILQRYVEWACPLKYDSVPKVVASHVVRAFIDTIAAMASGVNEPLSRKILAYEVRHSAAGDATVVGSSHRLCPASAALVNGTMAHALDYDDLLTSTRSHPSTVLVPAVLALGETLKSSGAEVLTAYLAGLEALDKIGSLVAFAQVAAGWHTTSTLGVLGAAAGAAKLLKLPEQQMRMAIGIAASMAGGLKKNFGTMTKPLHAGLAAQSGVMAALLAADGFTASEDVFSGPNNYLEVLAPKTKQAGLPSFGSPFAVIFPGLHFKRYPCCFATHRALDAVFNIRSEFPGLDADQILSVTCTAPGGFLGALMYDNPTTGLEGKFSMQYTVSAAFIDGRVDMHTFTDVMVRRKDVRSLMAKVSKIEDPTLPLADPDGTDRRFTEVAVMTKDGRVLKNRVVRPKGSVDVPLTDQEMRQKFVDCCIDVLAADRHGIVLDMLNQLESVKDICELMEHLRALSKVAAER